MKQAMQTVTIRTGKGDWLSQAKLLDALKQVFGASWIDVEVPIKFPTPKKPNNTIRIDGAYISGGKKIAVEYDGDMHYVNTRKCLRDREKDNALRREGYDLVRFPYYLELDSQAFKHFFGEDVQVENLHPKPLTHGFTETEWLPIHFCPLGIERFRREFTALPSAIQEAIAASLRVESEKWGVSNIVPCELQDLLQDNGNNL